MSCGPSLMPPTHTHTVPRAPTSLASGPKQHHKGKETFISAHSASPSDLSSLLCCPFHSVPTGVLFFPSSQNHRVQDWKEPLWGSPGQEPTNSYCNRQDGTYFRLCWPYSLCYNCLTLPLQCESSCDCTGVKGMAVFQ